ncbi:hypothetical protein [Metaclostridioides mangenotii]|uniref:hypothetical protein n=1 Tax=Metaclostridioides mangenotii TaxID=1540 RepID=UPI0028E63FA9|nr:hypothetical protein [Clostridioides mangenotii]
MKNVKIGALTYTIERTEDPIILNNKLCSGMIDYSTLTIKIDSKLDEQVQNEVLIHEITHGIIMDRNLILEDEEMIVEEICKGLHQLIVNNFDKEKLYKIYFNNDGELDDIEEVIEKAF